MNSAWWLIGSRQGAWSWRVNRPTARLGLGLLLLCFALGIWSLYLGSLRLTPEVIWQTLTQPGHSMAHTVILQWRLPRIVMAWVAGMALAIAGGIFQSLLRNPMGSPDVIGFNTGAWSGVLLTVVLFKGGEFAMALGSLLGGCLTAGIIFLLAWQQGLARMRLIIIGIAISALLNAVNIWVMMSASQESALTAVLWSMGSLNGMTWRKCMPVLIGCIPLILLCLSANRPLRQLELGDDIAQATGVRIQSSRLLLLLSATAVAAIATTMTGPIPFIALAAPQIAARLCRDPSPSLLCTGLTGAALLLSADLLAQHALEGIQLPVGIVTISLGGLYLLILLLSEARRSSS